jgi:hypothetical protein
MLEDLGQSRAIPGIAKKEFHLHRLTGTILSAYLNLHSNVSLNSGMWQNNLSKLFQLHWLNDSANSLCKSINNR